MTSHAAVVARGMGALRLGRGRSVDRQRQHRCASARMLKEGDVITIDGSTGDVFAGAVPTIEPELGDDFATLMGWADRHRRMKVRTNAETPEDCRMARLRRRGHRPVPHRAHVLRRRAHPLCAPDDPGRG
jgi:pyruvate,orthophosphate dikinase